MFHRTRDAIEAHLTIVFAALAVAREVQNRTGLSIRQIVRQLRPLRSATIAINGTSRTFPPAIPTEQQAILDALSGPVTHQANEPTRALVGSTPPRAARASARAALGVSQRVRWFRCEARH